MSSPIAERRWRNYRTMGSIAALAALSACSSVPLTPADPGQVVPVAAAPTVARSDLPALPPAGSGRGGYYMDDGPGDVAPEGLLAAPDAEPRVEQYTKRGNRPYQVFGKSYTPFTDDRPYKERGKGSWYGKKFHGQTTSSGEPYDMYKMSAAHPTLPLPSYARVTNLENGRQVVVRVNDRGPFLAGRVIDLSYTAALKLGYLAKGSALLEVERLLPDEIARMSARRAQNVGLAADTSGDAELLAVVAHEMPPRAALAIEPVMPVPAQPVTATASPQSTGPGIYLQLGAFGQAANAEALRNRFVQHPAAPLPPIEIIEQGALYRVYSGPFASREAAESAVQRLRNDAAFTPLVVQR